MKVRKTYLDKKNEKYKKEAKVGKVMGEYKSGELRSGKPGPGKGKKVTSKKQAVAIAMSEAGMSKKRKK